MPLDSKTYASLLLGGIILICLVAMVARWRIIAADSRVPAIGLRQGPVHYSGQSEPEQRSHAAPVEPAIQERQEVRLDINTADARELQDLPGIGPVLAERIISYRQQSGPFRSVEQLTEVEGIGDSTLERIMPLVTAATD